MKTSNCCGAYMNEIFQDVEICPDCKEYCGLEEKTVNRIMNLNSRYFYISRTYPNYVVSEREIFLL